MLTRNFNELQRLVAEDVANERVVQGGYWNHKEQHGCFIGCLTRSNNPAIAEKQWGIPVMLQRVAESVFEALPPDEARQFFADLPAAIGCNGKDLGLVSWQFLAAELRALPPQPTEIQAAIDPIIAGLKLLAAGQEWPTARSAADAAAEAEAAKAAAWAAGAAAWAAKAAAEAAEGAWAAKAAAEAAEGAWAAWAASAAANAKDGQAARLSARRRQRDTLLRLIKEAPVQEAAGHG